jgi:hypothetical protein
MNVVIDLKPGEEEFSAEPLPAMRRRLASWYFYIWFLLCVIC